MQKSLPLPKWCAAWFGVIRLSKLLQRVPEGSDITMSRLTVKLRCSPHMVTGATRPTRRRPLTPKNAGVETDDEAVFPSRNKREENSQTSDVTEQYENIIDAITTLPNKLKSKNTNHKLLHRQVPTLRGNKDRFNEVEYLLRNHVRPFSNQLRKEAKLENFQSLLREEVVQFFQSLMICTETTPTDVLDKFRVEFTKDDLKRSSDTNWIRQSLIQRWNLLPIFWSGWGS